MTLREIIAGSIVVIGLPFVMAWDLLDELTRGLRQWIGGRL